MQKNRSKHKHTPAICQSVEDLRALPLQELLDIAENLKIEQPQELRRQDLIFEILKSQVSQGGFILLTGILEVSYDGYGFLRAIDTNLAYNSPNDAYVSPTQIRRFGLRNGDIVTGQVRAPKDKEKYYALLKIEAINYLSLNECKKRPLFDNLTPIYPNDKLKLEYNPKRLTGRVLDMFIPIGKGQRGLIVAPPRSGKTELLKQIAHGISQNHPEVELIVLLIDERPEEVTDMQRSVKGEVFSSTFDQPAKNHVRISELIIEKAKRRVELGKDVVILLDSITRLARAYNTVTPSSGKVLSGGVDASALHKPKRFFGAARNVEDGGSLTIIATALVDTGSQMDKVIFEEFKGTGNCEVVLSRELSNKRIYPAIDLVKSGTRKEDLLINDQDLARILAIRSAIGQMDSEVESLKFLYSKIKSTKDNEELLNILNK